MALDRVWRNGPFGIGRRGAGDGQEQDRDAGDTDHGAVSAFAVHARAHARRLSLMVVAAAAGLAVVMWLIICVLARREHDAALAHARIEGANLTAALADQVSQTLWTIDRAMLLFADEVRRNPQDLDIHQIQAQIAGLARPILQAGMIGPDGKLRSSTLLNQAESIDLSDREHFRVHLNSADHDLFISKPVLGRLSQRTTIQLSRRVQAADGTFLGVVVFSLPPEDLATLHRTLDLGQHGIVSLVGTDNIVRARFYTGPDTRHAGVGSSVVGPPWPFELPPGEAVSFRRTSVFDHVTRLITARRLMEYPLLVVVGLDLDDVLAVQRTHAWVIRGIGGALTILLAGLTGLLVRELWRRTAREVELASEQARLQDANAAVLAERAKLAAANTELRASGERAEAANRAKSRFLAQMSHELRTPLHAIIGFAEVIKDSPARSQAGVPVADYAGHIWSSGRHLLEVINAILDISRVDAGTAHLSEATVRIADVVRAAAAAVHAQAEARRVILELDLPDNLPAVRVDAGKLRQIIVNLVGNAVKFSPSGDEVTVAAREHPDGGVVLSVTDTGLGMSGSEMAVALEPFGQVEGVLSRSTGGAGLGLPLAKGLAELHGGALHIRSAKGAGTTVEVWIPAQRVIRQGASADAGS
jgi:signal transduction histidine kinase